MTAPLSPSNRPALARQDVLVGLACAVAAFVAQIVGFDVASAPVGTAWRWAPGEVWTGLAFALAWGLGLAPWLAGLGAAVLLALFPALAFAVGFGLSRRFRSRF